VQLPKCTHQHAYILKLIIDHDGMAISEIKEYVPSWNGHKTHHMEVHGWIQMHLISEKKVYKITPTGVAEWKKIEKFYKELIHGEDNSSIS
jgi:hypothetical protein